MGVLQRQQGLAEVTAVLGPMVAIGVLAVGHTVHQVRQPHGDLAGTPVGRVVGHLTRGCASGARLRHS